MKTTLVLLVVSALPLLPAVASGQTAAPDERPLATAVREALERDPRRSPEAQRLAQQRLLDLQLAQLVSQRLIEAGLSDLVVACHDGQVELRGRASGPELRQHATELARATSGVLDVDNALLVPGEPQPPPAAQAAPQAVEPAPASSTEPFDFATIDGLAGRGLRVDAADGIVRLTGDVNTEGARTYAASAAQSVPGVRVVRDELVVHLATQAQSRRLAVLVQRQIEFDPLVQPIAPMVLVKVRDGIVRLEGRVQDDSQLQRAAALAGAQTGVFAVDNRLEIDEDLLLLPTRRSPQTVMVMR